MSAALHRTGFELHGQHGIAAAQIHDDSFFDQLRSQGLQRRSVEIARLISVTGIEYRAHQRAKNRRSNGGCWVVHRMGRSGAWP